MSWSVSKHVAWQRIGETAVLVWNWMIPMSAAAHSCLLALVTCSEDALNAPGVLEVGQLVNDQNNVTLKNLTVVP